MDNTPVVGERDILLAFKGCGVCEGDILLAHSSLKSFGRVEGGGAAVIAAAKAAVGPRGTLVLPTLVQRDFDNAYANWDKDTSPSDVGAITELFRTMPGSLRSNQATHSVAAQGRLAQHLTGEHTAYGPRMGVFGDYCFSYSSPWQKMYLLDAKVVFIGVSTLYNTFKHFAEYCFVEQALAGIRDIETRCEAMAQIAVFGSPPRKWPNGVWPFHDADYTQRALDEAGLLSYSRCGGAGFICLCARSYVDFMLRLFAEDPRACVNEAFCDWYEKYAMPGRDG